MVTQRRDAVNRVIQCLEPLQHADAQVPQVSASQILDAACQQAAEEDKNVFIIFHASWCQWCRKLDTILSRPDVKPLLDSEDLENDEENNEHIKRP